jgi:hypothetical protein
VSWISAQWRSDGSYCRRAVLGRKRIRRCYCSALPFGCLKASATGGVIGKSLMPEVFLVNSRVPMTKVSLSYNYSITENIKKATGMPTMAFLMRGALGSFSRSICDRIGDI